MAKKRVKVDAKECIMCGACVGSYPEDFEFADDGTAKPITGEADEICWCMPSWCNLFRRVRYIKKTSDIPSFCPNFLKHKQAFCIIR